MTVQGGIKLFKKVLLLTLAIAIFTFSGCKPTTPISTAPIPPVSADTMIAYKQLIEKNVSPAELLKFADTNIAKLSKEDADTIITDFITQQQKQKDKYDEKIFSDEFNVRLNNYKYEDLLKLINISDTDIRDLLQSAYNDGFKLYNTEGMNYIEPDFVMINDKFSKFVSDELAAYLNIMSVETKLHFAEDAGLTITLEQLADRIFNTEQFMDKYNDSRFFKEIQQWHSYYMSAYLIGMNNTPAFDYTTDKLNTDFAKSYEASKIRYKDSKLAATLNEYTQLLQKNNYKKTEAVLTYVNNVTGLQN